MSLLTVIFDTRLGVVVEPRPQKLASLLKAVITQRKLLLVLTRLINKGWTDHKLPETVKPLPVLLLTAACDCR